MKKLLFSVAMLAIVAVSCNKEDDATLIKEPMTIGVTASGLDLNYSPLATSRAIESANLLAVQVYEGETPVANGLVEDWSNLSFEGYSNTTYTVVATMIVDATTDIYCDGTTYGLPFNSEITSNLVLSPVALSGLASSTAKLSSGSEYTVPNIDRYYGTTTKRVTTSSSSITTSMKRMSFGVKYNGESTININITGAPVTTMSDGVTELFSLTDFEAAYTADETTDAYSEIIATKFGDNVTSYDITYKRNQEVTITFQDSNFGFEFETGFESVKGTRVLTFEDADYNAGENYIGLYSWSSLIDNYEYGGLLLYGVGGSGVTTPYEWTDTNNTFLHNKILDSWGMGSYEFWNGGIAVSNYYTEAASGLAYTYQLSVPIKDEHTGGSGNNGSQNFAVVNADVYSQTSLYFADDVDRVVDHLYIANTSYASSTCLYGDGYSSDPFTTGNNFWVTLTGYNLAGEQTGTVKYYLATDGALEEGWNKCDLSSLGAVNRINFNIDSDVTNNMGSVVPSYIAIDDIAVVFE